MRTFERDGVCVCARANEQTSVSEGVSEGVYACARLREIVCVRARERTNKCE